MNVSLYQAASALNANSRWQEVISENLASSAIVGFKKGNVSFESVQAGLMPQPASASPQHFHLPRGTPHTILSQGDLKVTGETWDLALEGPGFFEVQLPNGNLAYTRNGAFQLDAQGRLVTSAGLPVLGEAGVLQFDRANPQPIVIGSTGEIRQGVAVIGKLRVANFDDPSLLESNGGLFFATHPGLDAFPAANAQVRQGYLEAANTSAVHEMANLIMAMRHHEANQKVIQTQDERMGRAINELANSN